jgi:hypothetical protein
MPNNQVNVTELNRAEPTTAPLGLLRLLRDLEALVYELRTAEETMGQPVWTYRDPLAERLRRVGVSAQKVEEFSALGGRLFQAYSLTIHVMKIS